MTIPEPVQPDPELLHPDHPKRSRTRHRRRHRWPLIALLVVLVILAGTGGGSYVAYANVKGQAGQLQAQLTAHLQAGQTELEAGKASLKSANASHNPALVGQASVHFINAKLQFSAARQIADSSQLLQRLEDLPMVGEQALSRHTAVDAVAEMGIAISDGGLELATLDGQLLKPPGGGQQARTLLTVLNQTHTSLVKVRGELDRALKAAAQVDVQVLPTAQQGTFSHGKETLKTALAAIDEFERLVPVVTEMLGGIGVRTYLIEQLNPAELRPGGGLISTFSVLRADRGTLTLIRNGDAHDLIEPRPFMWEPGYIAPPGPLRETVIPYTSWSFLDSNFFPDFPSNARAAESFVEPRLGVKIDAVISIDVYTVAMILELTGPIAVPGVGITLNSGNFVPVVTEHSIAQDAVHKAIVNAIAGSLMQRVTTLPPDRWPVLITGLNNVAASRHFQVFFNNDTVQKEIVRIGWSGTLNPTSAADYLMEVEANLGPSKANYYITRRYTVELTRNGAVLHHKVTVDILNDMPYYFRPDEFYHPYLRLYVGATATGGKTDLRRVRYPNPAPPAGTALIDGWVPTFHGYGHSAEAVFEYDSPWTPNGRGEHKIYWQKQPGTLNDNVDIIWQDGSGHTFKTSGDIAQDRVITLASKVVTIAPGQSAQAQLPSLSLG